MQLEQSTINLKPWEAILVVLILFGGISYSIIFLQMIPHIPIVIGMTGLMGYGLIKKVNINEIEAGMMEGIRSGLGAILLFFFIGMLISSWMASGTIPTFFFLAMELVSEKYFYAIAFVVTAIIGISTGSSFTASATLGVAFVSVSVTIGISPAITAGAVVSGAFFGDKMSPLSDTTNLASMVAEVNLFEHIRNMAWTTVPASIISLVLFAYLSPEASSADFTKMSMIKSVLLKMNLVHWYSFIPLLILMFLALKKASTLITLSASIMAAMVISIFVQKDFHLHDALNLLYSGYKSDTGIKEIDSLLTAGGMESMMFSISLVLLALSMGGLLFKLGIFPVLLQSIQKLLKGTASLIFATATTAIGINFLLGEQYLSILLPGNAFKDRFQQAGLESKNLSRVLEDAGTVVNALVPWGVSGIFLTNILGVSTLEYLPFTFFCLLSPVLTVLFGLTGWTITTRKTIAA
ncbi:MULTISPECIES: Na+/H+ antiporter NhaC [unclassified Bacillus (in: firmicutes)]|uniref:Na+/H+ antiporter NhaC n=1 Tax=unclassified Bacillus (in: firmicutes) TaxID=185979 RepID=UPI0008F1C3FC|nr:MULTISPECIES: Na+/H+ antiporter NhaC [unclassified Bacillus (in: firmicutes)]SFA77557.1 Na+:H+ antiporter, NhaC family [Bacillus sp. UNCCL13]SFQ67479.1 transporter, NhaC family [Bacillus sp. cl95]